MPHYKLYCMNGHGKLGYVEQLVASNDEEAIRLARAKKLPVDCEIWDGTRLVAEIPSFE